MKKNSLLAIMAFLSYLISAQNYTWSSVSSCPEALYSAGSFTIGNNMYVVCGGTNVAHYPKVLSHHVWQYNATTDTWTQKADFPGVAVYGTRGFSIGSYGYIVNGWDSTGSGSGSSTLWQYNPATDTWVTKAPFIGSTRYTTATFVVNNKAYITLGYSPYVANMFEYDPATDSWSQKANFPGAARQEPMWFTIGNYGYVCMGVSAGYYVHSDFYRYDPSSDTWARMSDFPSTPLSSASCFVVNNEGYLVNGLTQDNQTYGAGAAHEVWKYSPSSNSWSFWGVFPGMALFDGVYSSVGGLGYMGLGASNYTTFPLTNSFYKFGPASSPYSCAAIINKFRMNNTTYNYQANGSFSPSAQLIWDFGDGTSASGTSVIHSFSTAGQHIVSLSITDTSGSTCSGTSNDTLTISSVSTCSVSIHSTSFDSSYTLIPVVVGSGPYTYQWSCTQDSNFNSTVPDPFIGINANTPTTYCVTVSDTLGCHASSCITLNYSPDSAHCRTYLYVYPDGDQPGLYFVDVFHTGNRPVSYFWSFGDGHTSTDSFPSYTYITAGRYNLCLTITDDSGCVSTYCDSFFYDYKFGGGPMKQFNAKKGGALPADLALISANDYLSVYPNPASNTIIINANGVEIQEVNIYSVTGQKILNVNAPTDNRIYLDQIAHGLYNIEVKTKSDLLRSKFIKID